MFPQFAVICIVLCLRGTITAVPVDLDSSVITLTELRSRTDNRSLLGSTSSAKRYFSNSIKTDWYTAGNACKDSGLQLLQLKTAEDQWNVGNYIYENGLVTAGSRFWIGLSDFRQKGTWVWDDGALLVRNPNWFTANNDLRDCASLTPPGSQSADFTWDPMIFKSDIHGYEPLSFICETT